MLQDVHSWDAATSHRRLDVIVEQALAVEALQRLERSPPDRRQLLRGEGSLELVQRQRQRLHAVPAHRRGRFVISDVSTMDKH